MRKKKRIYLLMKNQKGLVKAKIGWWHLSANEANDDFDRQQDIGWHIMMHLRQREGNSVEIIVEEAADDE